MNDHEKPVAAPAEDRGLSASAASPSAVPGPAQIQVDDSQVFPNYANFCRLSGTPEELLIDFGLNTQPTSQTAQHIEIKQRVVTGWHTAKRLISVLQTTVNRHEAVFGVLETDIRKRIERS